MYTEHLNQLAALIRQEQDQLLAEWRNEVRQLSVAHNLDVPTLNDHIPDLLEELARELDTSSDDTMIKELKENPIIHGLDRLRLGFDVEEVVAEYNALRSVIQDLVERHDLRLSGSINRIINRVIDKSIALAVKTYAAQKAIEVQQRREEHLSFVAHDLRAPLSAMAMATQLLESTLPHEAKGGQDAMLLGTLQRNINRLSALVVKVMQEEANLNANGSEKLDRREVQLRALVQGLINDLQPLAESSNTKLINYVPEELTVFADANLLTLVFQNLVSNAIKYTGQGEVTIGAGANEEIECHECWVSDNGAGIAAERLEKVFDKLETDPDRKDGMGLGLAIVKQFVEAHGGQVTVNSQVGEGSTFRFKLPYKAEVEKRYVDKS